MNTPVRLIGHIAGGHAIVIICVVSALDVGIRAEETDFNRKERWQ